MFELILFAAIGCLVYVLFVRLKDKSRDETELWVESELKKRLPDNNYIVFGNLIIPSVSKEIRSTQLDHVIISTYGIFCLETKSHRGNIYGHYKRKYWKQYLGYKTYDLYNPLRQNSHHVRSLEYLLRSRLKSPIHSYIVFPSANSVKLGGQKIDLTLTHTIERILKHRRLIYDQNDIEAISKGLAYVSSRSTSLSKVHVSEVNEYIEKYSKPNNVE